jgi:hypothetical protein
MTPTQFMPSFPCYAIFADDCLGPYLLDATSKRTMLVLTDRDLLQQFRATGGSAGPTIEFDSAMQLALYISALPGAVTHIAFDPTGTGSAVIVEAKELYQRLFPG